ncbi:YdcF family protein [Mucilaginibacter sp. Bleaf8]|uniref:YdcF family protein n=1 Tax=Mucilaginibacter sp. Bleaf8 TaxID=2834430 RepID=UPI001BD1AC9F|nr:YdcF family protein [Mucilaginibacter sp. Bleaf8]MBS7563602.1 YdcF family protein [Mucilaginibacter sp. Bleaf8]
MMFVLSKVLLFITFPITWVFIIFISAIILKKPHVKQRLCIVGVLLLYTFSIPFFLNVYAKLWSYPSTSLNLHKTYSCAIILGGFSSRKADKTGYFNGAADRFIQALKLKATGKASHLLITSGNASLRPDTTSEGVWVGRQLKELNIPDSSILIESKSRNTIENALFTRQLLKTQNLKPPYLLVTSDFHMRRAMLIFKHTGIDVIPYTCHYIAGTDKISLNSFWPHSDVLYTWEIYTKELVGYVVARLHKY